MRLSSFSSSFPSSSALAEPPHSPHSQWWSRTIIHTLTIRFGLRGQMSYTAVSRDGVQLLKYIAKGDMGADASLKTGTYRLSASGMTPSLSWVGDCEFFFGR